MPRHLASVRTIDSIRPIEGADRIECAYVDAWPVVVRKGQFAPGDKCVYFEIDSVLDVCDPRFAFLAPRGVKKFVMLDDDGEPQRHEGHVLRTAKLRKQLSQGLVMTLEECGLDPRTPIDADVTDALGVIKYDPYEPLSGGPSVRVGGFPQKYCMRSDAERVQNLKDAWPELLAHDWYATVKVDGTSSTILMDEDGNRRVASRNMEVAWSDVEPRIVGATASGITDCLEPCMAVQFELCGPKVNGNRLDLVEPRAFVYGVWVQGHPISRDQWPEACIKASVPVLPDLEFPQSAEEAVAQAYGLNSHVTKGRADEGIVWHEATGAQLECLDFRECCKAINDKYLLKYDSD